MYSPISPWESANHKSVMKVLITTGIFPPEIGGPATYSRSFAYWLWERKHDAAVLAGLAQDLDQAYPFPVIVARKKGSLLWHVKAFFKILKVAKAVDILYINGLMLESFTAAFLRKKGRVVRVPGDLVWERAIRKDWTQRDFFAFQSDMNANTRIRFLRWLRRYQLNRVDRVIAPSQFLAGIVENWGVEKEKITVVYNPYTPVEKEDFPLPPGAEGKSIVVTGGRLVPWKGIAGVMEVVRDIPGTCLVVAGDGPDRAGLHAHARSLGLEEKVFFTGQLSRGQLGGLLEKARCFVLNSRYEGLPHIVLEAMAAGCPVIASNIGGNPEVVDHGRNGFLVEPGNGKDIAATIAKLKNDDSLYKRIIAAGRKTLSEKFDREKSYLQMERLLKEISG